MSQPKKNTPKLSEDEQDQYEERVAIMVHDGSVPLKDAERAALARIMEKRETR